SSRTAIVALPLLDRRAWNCAVGTEDTAVALLGLERPCRPKQRKESRALPPHGAGRSTRQPILASAAIRERIIALGAEPASCTPDQLAKLLANDLKRLEPIAKRTGARLD